MEIDGDKVAYRDVPEDVPSDLDTVMTQAAVSCLLTVFLWCATYLTTRCGWGMRYRVTNYWWRYKFAAARGAAAFVCVCVSLMGAPHIWWWAASCLWLPTAAAAIVYGARHYGWVPPIDLMRLFVQAHMLLVDGSMWEDAPLLAGIASIGWLLQATDAAVGKDKNPQRYEQAFWPAVRASAAVTTADVVLAVGLVAVHAYAYQSMALWYGVGALRIVAYRFAMTGVLASIMLGIAIEEGLGHPLTLACSAPAKRFVAWVCRHPPLPPGRAPRVVRAPMGRVRRPCSM